MTFRDFVAKNKWKFAKTYAAFAPHEYVVRGQCVSSDEEFDKAGECIEKNGMTMYYYKAERKYLFLDGWFYWILRSKEDYTNAVINRCKPEDYDIVFMKRGTQRKTLAKEAEEKRKYEQLKFEWMTGGKKES